MTFHELISNEITNKDLKINIKKIFISDNDNILSQSIHQAITLAVSLSLQDERIIKAAYCYSENLEEVMHNAAKIAASCIDNFLLFLKYSECSPITIASSTTIPNAIIKPNNDIILIV